MATENYELVDRSDSAETQKRAASGIPITSLAHERVPTGKFHDGGEVKADGIYELEKGEHVLTEDQADKILPQANAMSPRSVRYAQSQSVPTAPAVAPAVAPTDIPAGSPWHDAAKPILLAAPTLTNGDRERLWDIFHESRDHNELAAKLAPVNVPNEVKHQLFMAKVATMPEPTHQEKIVGAINRLGTMASTPEGKRQLEIAEQHPNILRHLTSDKG
jgi:hypothetical protein